MSDFNTSGGPAPTGGEGGGEVTQGTSPWVVGDGGSTLSVDDGGSTLSIDDGGGNISIDDGGNTITVDGTITANAGTGNFSTVEKPASTGGASVTSYLNLGNTGQVPRAQAAHLYGLYLSNSATTVSYVKIYNKATAATSSDTPVIRCLVPPTGGATWYVNVGIAFSSGISVRAVTEAADNGTTSPGSNEIICNVVWA